MDFLATEQREVLLSLCSPKESITLEAAEKLISDLEEGDEKNLTILGFTRYLSFPELNHPLDPQKVGRVVNLSKGWEGVSRYGSTINELLRLFLAQYVPPR
jgi:hypothetical protein